MKRYQNDRGLSGLNTLSYMGVEPSTPPNITQEKRRPVAHDYAEFRVGDIWLVGGTEEVWILVNKDAQVATWIEIMAGNLAFHTDDGNNAYPAIDVINIVGGPNIATSAVPADGNNVIIGLIPLTGSGVVQTDPAGILFADNGANGQLLIGGGAAPTWANLTPGDNIDITDAANSITISVDDTTQHAVQIGNAAGSLTSMAVGATGETIMGSTGADPGWTNSPSFGGSVTAQTNITSTVGDLVASAGNLILPITSATEGVIYFNVISCFHMYGDPENLFVGQYSGNFTTTGFENAGFASLSLNSISTGVGNLGVGVHALQRLTTGSYNCSIGNLSGEYSISGQFNLFLGTQAGCDPFAFTGIATGSYNIIIGTGGGGFPYINAESSNILIGYGIFGTAGENNTMRIANGTGVAIGNLNRVFISGIRGITTDVADAIPVLIDSLGQLGTISSSRRYKQNIQDMNDASSQILNLRPVTFEYKQHPDIMQYGLVAEEVEEYMPRLVVNDKEGLPETVKYHELPVLLLNELQKQHRIIQELTERIKRLEN
jgi:hypothetical protein